MLRCLKDMALESLPPSVRKPAEKLRQLLEQHPFLKYSCGPYNVNEDTVGVLDSMVDHLRNLIHQTIESAENLPVSRTLEGLPSSFQQSMNHPSLQHQYSADPNRNKRL